MNTIIIVDILTTAHNMNGAFIVTLKRKKIVLPNISEFF